MLEKVRILEHCMENNFKTHGFVAVLPVASPISNAK